MNIVVSKSAILCTVHYINIDIPKNVQVPYYKYRRDTIC